MGISMTAQQQIKTAHKNVYVALAAAQMEMESVKKGSVNPAFKSRYADLADVLQVAMPALNRHGMTMFWGFVDDGKQSAFRTRLVHGETETEIFCDVPLIVAKNDMQGMKSAITYAKRIGAESVTGIAPEDDDGNAAAKSPPMVERNNPPRDIGPTAAQIAIDSLTNADTLEALGAIWQGLPVSIKGEAKVLKAKDDRKAALQPKPNADLDDEIKY